MIPVLITLPFAVFGMVFQLSFITVGKAGFGAALSVMGGVLNIVLDWLFVAIFHWGLAGGAVVDFFAKRWKNICDLIFLPNCHFHDRAGTDTARDLWHGWSMDVHYSW